MEQVGNYQYYLDQLIGKGPYSKVFRGEIKSKLNEKVAVRLLDDKYVLKSTLDNELIQNINKLKCLKHENIIRFYDVLNINQNIYFVMELNENMSLSQYVVESNSLDEKTIRQVLDQVFLGMKTLHQLEIVLRYMRPENILINFKSKKDSMSNGKEIVAKICNFGLEELLDKELLPQALSMFLPYVAPEVMLSRKFDLKCLSWSIGLIAYLCLLGKNKFATSSKKYPEIITKMPEDSSAEIEDFINNALKIAPKKRISFEDLVNHPFMNPYGYLKLGKKISFSDLYDLYNGNFGGKEVTIEKMKKVNNEQLMYQGKKFAQLLLLKHENLVPLLHFIGHEDHSLVVLDYYNEITLASYLDDHYPLESKTVSSFAGQLAEGMRALKMKNIVHRDLKPENILVSQLNEEKIIVKISGFSLSTILDEGKHLNDFCGSFIYMAPEVLLSLPYDGKCDLWSIGVILFECLTGQTPFDVNTIIELEEIYTNPQVNSKLSCQLNLTDEMNGLMVGLLTINPSERSDFDRFNELSLYVQLEAEVQGKENCVFEIPESYIKAEKNFFNFKKPEMTIGMSGPESKLMDELSSVRLDDSDIDSVCSE